MLCMYNFDNHNSSDYRYKLVKQHEWWGWVSGRLFEKNGPLHPDE